MMDVAHAYRDAHGIDEVAPKCSVKIRDAWSGDQTLRWVHVGLFSTGELLYLMDAITGLTMLTGVCRGSRSRTSTATHSSPTPRSWQPSS